MNLLSRIVKLEAAGLTGKTLLKDERDGTRTWVAGQDVLAAVVWLIERAAAEALDEAQGPDMDPALFEAVVWSLPMPDEGSIMADLRTEGRAYLAGRGGSHV